MQCNKCGRPLLDCHDCNQDRSLRQFDNHSCDTCANTGLVCAEHGGEWRERHRERSPSILSREPGHGRE